MQIWHVPSHNLTPAFTKAKVKAIKSESVTRKKMKDKLKLYGQKLRQIVHVKPNSLLILGVKVVVV